MTLLFAWLAAFFVLWGTGVYLRGLDYEDKMQRSLMGLFGVFLGGVGFWIASYV